MQLAGGLIHVGIYFFRAFVSEVTQVSVLTTLAPVFFILRIAEFLRYLELGQKYGLASL